MNKLEEKKLVYVINNIRKDHKQHIKIKFFNPVMFDKKSLMLQYEIIDLFYNRIISQIRR